MSTKIQDLFLSCKECILENPRSFYGSFVIGPFFNSQSLTVANALRRTLLGEIRNISITHLEINDVTHEYSTLEGIRESVVELLLNFKQIVLQSSDFLHHPVYGYLSVRGPGIIRASDLKLPPFIHIIDPDQYIATLSENGKLQVRFRISTADYDEKFSHFQNSRKLKKSISNFVSVGSFSQIKQEQMSENIDSQRIWLDPNFHPVLKVNYLIEKLESFHNSFGKMTIPQPSSWLFESDMGDFSSQKNFPSQVISFEIWTNGSIHPRETLYQALKYLKTMFLNLDDMRMIHYQFLEAALQSENLNTKFLSLFEEKYTDFQKKEQNDFEAFNLKTSSGFFSNNFQNTLTKSENSEKMFLEKFSFEKLGFSARLKMSLKKNNIFTLYDLLKYFPEELKDLSGIGNYSIYIIQKLLKEANLSLKKKL